MSEVVIHLMTYLINYVFKQIERIAGINESKALRKHVSCRCKCKFNGGKRNRNHKGHNDKCRRDFKRNHISVLVMKLQTRTRS